MYIDRQKETDRIHERCVQKEREICGQKERKRMIEYKKDVDRKTDNDRTKERCTQIDKKRLIEYTKDVYRKKD